jgi:hypothetical protein
MWVFTKIADWFDKTRQDNERFIDSQLQPWVATTLYEDHPWYRNVGVWTAAGTLYALNKFTTTVAAGFVDVLRVGDGIQEGGWGYGKDAMRLLMVVGPALRRDSTTTVSAISLRFLHFRDNSLCLSWLQVISIFGYSFYSFSYSLEFQLKRYHWYQSIRELCSANPPCARSISGLSRVRHNQRPHFSLREVNARVGDGSKLLRKGEGRSPQVSWHSQRPSSVKFQFLYQTSSVPPLELVSS